jgi:phenylpropionate dioxygenase-like ring-hydroxylating dioxygenase large terminal subunit
MASAHFLRNTWYAALWSVELAEGALFSRTILGEPLVFFRRSDGTVAAIADRCPHRFAPLSRGKLLEDRIRCGYHGLEVDGTGRCVYNPHGNHHIPPAAAVESYRVVERHSVLWIWMGEREPDFDAIPPFFEYDDAVPPLYVGRRDYLMIEANYELIVDNLLDLSHTSYLHPGILGNDEMKTADNLLSQDGNTVTTGRRNDNVPCPGLYDPLFRGDGGNVDKWNAMTWYPASNLKLDSGVCPVGGSREQGTGIVAAHLLTPETERTTHYLFSSSRWNVLTQDDAANARIRKEMSDTRYFVFSEQDGPMIEGQQRNIDRVAQTREPRFALLAVDVATVRYQRILHTLIEEEQHERRRQEDRPAHDPVRDLRSHR